ncbi:hypothetical protein [uncultured Jatrophihabitans sp.]|uniref:hypothetical protein n=1 Tax=uncultured Jatrophihabitans sp. TaxID=1610747 RepID=UPI0035CAF89D
MTDLDTTSNVPDQRHADAIGQATAVEQARAVAEVKGAIVVAQQCPRSTALAVQQMRESCAQKGLAERAFFRYSRGSGQITGPSVHLARELARCWGNMQYGITELSRDDGKGESQMLAFAWDVQTNTRATTTFIVKHGRDTKQGVKALTDMRDIYENNANNGARRLREQIFAILPKWFTEEAQDRCRTTLENGGDAPLPQRIATLVQRFGDLGVGVDQLERKIGRDQDRWNAHDVAALTVVGKSLSTGEARIEDEFPDDKVTVDEITKQQPAAKQANGRGKSQQKPTEGDPDDQCPICGTKTDDHDTQMHEMAGV